MKIKIKEFAKLSGVTVRTLHYYDDINLLKPSGITENGYRLYEEKEIEKLQEILFLKELDFSLTEIKEILTNPDYKKEEALLKQKELLIKKRQRLDKIINLLSKTIKGDKNMSFKEFDTNEIEEAKNKYKDEAKKNWGNSNAYKESERKTSNYNREKWAKVNEESNEIMKEFAKNKNLPVNSKEVQELVERWQNYITNNFYTCTKEILKGLGEMYIADERFKNNINKHGEGTAEFMTKSIEFYCNN